MEPSECLGRASLARTTAHFLLRDEVDARLSMRVSMKGRDALFLLARDGHDVGERLLPRRSLSCEKFLAVVAAAVAVAIDTADADEIAERSRLPATEAGAEQGAEPVSESPPAPTLPAPRRESPLGPPPPRPAWRVDVGAEVGALAALHAPAPTVALGLGVVRSKVGRAGLSAFATLPAETSLGGRNVRVELFAARFDGCLSPPIRRVPIAPCAAAIVGLHRAEGILLSASSSDVADSTLWAALAIGPEANLTFGRWSLIARVEPWWVLRPSRLVTERADGAELSKTAPHLGLGAFFGVRWSIL